MYIVLTHNNKLHSLHYLQDHQLQQNSPLSSTESHFIKIDFRLFKMGLYSNLTILHKKCIITRQWRNHEGRGAQPPWVWSLDCPKIWTDPICKALLEGQVTGKVEGLTNALYQNYNNQVVKVI